MLEIQTENLAPKTECNTSLLPDALVRVVRSEATLSVNQIAGLAHNYRSSLSAIGAYPSNINEYGQTNPRLLIAYSSVKGKIETLEQILNLLGQRELVERLKAEANPETPSQNQ